MCSRMLVTGRSRPHRLKPLRSPDTGRRLQIGFALLALCNIAFIVPLQTLLLAVSSRRVLGQIGRWNRANSPWIKATIALAVIAMSFGLMGR